MANMNILVFNKTTINIHFLTNWYSFMINIQFHITTIATKTSNNNNNNNKTERIWKER